jgi:hypothetical protein
MLLRGVVVLTGVGLARSELPIVFLERFRLALLAHDCGQGEREVRFLQRAARPVLPVWQDGRLILPRRRCRRGDSRHLLCTAWTRLASILNQETLTHIPWAGFSTYRASRARSAVFCRRRDFKERDNGACLAILVRLVREFRPGHSLSPKFPGQRETVDVNSSAQSDEFPLSNGRYMDERFCNWLSKTHPHRSDKTTSPQFDRHIACRLGSHSWSSSRSFHFTRNRYRTQCADR